MTTSNGGITPGEHPVRRIVGDGEQVEAFIPLKPDPSRSARNASIIAEAGRRMARGTELQVYQRADERWAWRLLASNGEVIATDGGQGYENRGDCERVAKAVVVGFYAPRDLA